MQMSSVVIALIIACLVCSLFNRMRLRLQNAAFELDSLRSDLGKHSQLVYAAPQALRLTSLGYRGAVSHLAPSISGANRVWRYF
jgi:hypothetical protein